MTEQGIVKKTLIEIFKKNGYEDLSRLTQRDYDHISHEIETSTATLISGSTIKRLLHGEFSRLPQIATLNAISNYLGYKNWQEYKSSFRHTEQFLTTEKKDNRSEINTHKNSLAKFKRFKLIALATLALGVITIAGFIQFSERKTLPDFNKASFSVRKNTTNEIPNTVVFNYNVDDVEADSFFIQQSWDKNRRVKVFKKNYTLTDIYYEPGYHTAKLIANDSVIRTADISIPTDRWFLFAKDIIPGSKPEYIKVDPFKNDGFLTITEKGLIDNKIDAQGEREYVYTFFPSKIDVSSDNYVLKTRLRMKEVRNNFCPYVMVEVFCQKYFMFFRSTPRGCASESALQFGENFVSGKQNDLSSLGCDVTQWMDVEVSVINKQAVIKLNNKEVFLTTYKKNTGFITGLGFISNGLCEIDFVELKGLDGTIVYESDFVSKNNGF